MTDDERYRTIDLPFYRDEVAPILPPRVLDFHAHTWRADNWRIKPWDTDEAGGRYMVTTEYYPPEKLLEDGARAFPDREYEAVCFGYPTPAVDWEKDTAFVSEAGRRYPALHPFVLAGPDLGISEERYREALDRQGFVGLKVFLNWFGDDYGRRGVQEMVGPVERRLANEYRLPVMLHVPRADRLADPEIQDGVRRLAEECPEARIVLAHGGRCYLPEQMRRAIGAIRDLENVVMDASMVMDALCFEMIFDTIGSRRLLYASDFPVAAMRGRRVRVMDHWVDVVLEDYPDSAYRVKSNGIRATFMAVEIAVAIRDAAARCGIGADELRRVFYDNGMALLERVRRPG